MTEELRTIIRHRFERAHETLAEARILFEDYEHIIGAVNRLYYACFYAVSGLLLLKDLSSSKHQGVRAFFHQHFVKTGLIEKTYGKLYDKLFENRQLGDYNDFVRFDADEVAGWFKEAQQFVQTLEAVVNKELTQTEVTPEPPKPSASSVSECLP